MEGIVTDVVEAPKPDSLDDPEAIREQVLSIVVNLPAMRGIYYQVVRELNDSNGSLDSIADLVARDPVLTGKVLQLANSAAVGLSRRVQNAKEAVLAVGGEQVKSIVLFVEAFSICSGIRVKNFSPETLWRHSTRVAKSARQIMRAQSGSPSDLDTAFTAGLMHDIGKLLLMRNVPERYLRALDRAESESAASMLIAEREEFGITHADVGAIVLGSWSIPDEIVQAVRSHHDPTRLSRDSFGPSDAVAVANWMAQGQKPWSQEARSEDPMTTRILELWSEDQLEVWCPTR